ncbi:hypothetical protein COU74_01325 [Candidatus Peregrinibacteria bacterium CG10_big_fil_rev_8_21_14_0_10_36_19]|nr:MAG: hypothetical protein COU74_01325 [Candidatus Peregrinibacteria bacterium CG10_big_fil_rev_8_21_14_0_10_36_19]
MKIFKKISITALVGAIVVFSALYQIKDSKITHVSTIKFEGNITLESRPVAFAGAAIAPYKDLDVFLSEEISSDFEFTSVGGYWEQVMPQGTNVQTQIRFKVDNKWSEWLTLDADDDSFGDKYTTASTNPATAMQYKFLLYGDGLSKPTIQNPEWTFLRTGSEFVGSNTPSPQFSASMPVSQATYLALTATPTNLISRSNWGAKESYRYLANNDEDPILAESDSDFQDKYKEELKFSRVVDKDSSGNKYKWPLQYAEKVKKIIIHHTATTKDLDNPKQAVRDIYYYHTVSRGWGDIGYNYIVDKNGNVYEGRYGGEGIVGAHTAGANNGAIGIAVLGNYEATQVPDAVMRALSNLIAEKSKIHNIDVTGTSIFRGENSPNLFAHRDFGSTTCPGAYLYERVPELKAMIASIQKPQKPKFVKDYDFEDLSNLYYLELKPNETLTVTMKMENIGKKTWDNKTFLVVDKNSAFEGVISFPESDPVILAKMDQASVEPGKTATFKFKIKGGTKGDKVNAVFSPVINGSYKTLDNVRMPISVQQGDYRYQYIEQKFPDTALKTSTNFTGQVRLKNTGNTVWQNSGNSMITLRPDHPRDRASEFTKGDFATLQQKEVKPGEIGTFVFNLKTPKTAGSYKEFYSPFVKDAGWLKDTGTFFEVTVLDAGEKAETTYTKVESDTANTNNKYIEIKLRNLGQTTWNKTNLNVSVAKQDYITLKSANLDSTEVKPGQIGSIKIALTIDPQKGPASKAVSVVPRLNKAALLSAPITVNFNDKDTKITRAEDIIRIKLRFEGDASIVASTDYDYYQNGSFVKTYSQSYAKKITLDDVKNGPVRLQTRSGGVLRITNYDNRPSWNLSLNDNQFRNVLEFREQDGKLIVINELQLEDYLKGLGEVSNSEEPEKIKAVIVAARTYAKYYITVAEKFAGKPYHLEDDPNTSQKYLGYGFELRGPNIAKAVDQTAGEVVTYKGSLIKTPYFNQSNGISTKSAKEVWGWTDTPYLQSVSDTYCKGDKFLGHGVGLSGCGSKGMALAGKTYVEILKHYYTGVEIERK